jgi:type I restriction enzyme S subunit
MAVQGKLVPQDPNDEPASVLLERVCAEKERLMKEGKIKKEKLLPPITEEEISFDVPDPWALVRLDDIGVYRKGPFGSSLTKSMFVPKSEASIKVYEQKNAIQKDSTIGDYYITKEYFEAKMRGFEVFPGDVIVSCAGTIGETYVMPDGIEQGIINQALMRMQITSAISLDYFLLYFDYVLKRSAQGSSKGSAIKNIPPFEIFKMLVFPLPPLAEQCRIVDRIEQLLPHIAKYDAAEQKLTSLNKQFPDQLKKSILQAAVQGKLVEQDPNDEPASVLLERIRAEKEQLVKEGKIKKEKPLPPIADEDIPFDVPEGWEWVRLGDAGETQTGTTPPTSNPNNFGKHIPFIKPADITDVSIDYYNEGLSAQGLEKGRLIKSYSILMVCIGGSIGKCFYVDRDVSCNQQINAITPLECISYKYLFFMLQSPYAYELIKETATGTATPIINKSKWENIPFPLPPLSEQRRIVAKCEELLAMVEGCRDAVEL